MVAGGERFAGWCASVSVFVFCVFVVACFVAFRYTSSRNHSFGLSLWILRRANVIALVVAQ